jgi:hypothetical protein
VFWHEFDDSTILSALVLYVKVSGDEACLFSCVLLGVLVLVLEWEEEASFYPASQVIYLTFHRGVEYALTLRKHLFKGVSSLDQPQWNLSFLLQSSEKGNEANTSRLLYGQPDLQEFTNEAMQWAEEKILSPMEMLAIKLR